MLVRHFVSLFHAILLIYLGRERVTHILQFQRLVLSFRLPFHDYDLFRLQISLY